MTSTDRATKLNAYASRTDTTLAVLAGAFIVLYALEVLVPDLSQECKRMVSWANYGIWACFLSDLIIRTCLAPSRLRYLLTHPVDVLAVVLPALRSLRVLRIFASGQLLLNRQKGLARAGQAIVFVAGLLMVIGALAVLDAERAAPNALITTFPDALWWAMTTLTTVGYGDLYPVTPMGRGVAAALMIVGISLLGVVTASIASWFVSHTTTPQEDENSREESNLEREVKMLREQVSELTSLVAARSPYPQQEVDER